jgi:hypothetical protein
MTDLRTILKSADEIRLANLFYGVTGSWLEDRSARPVALIKQFVLSGVMNQLRAILQF